MFFLRFLHILSLLFSSLLLASPQHCRNAKDYGLRMAGRNTTNMHGNTNAHLLEVLLLGVGTVLSLEKAAWSMVEMPRRATND